jgi:hypothetical protein
MNEWKLFKDELPKEKTHILVKKEWSDEEFAEWEESEQYEKIDYLAGILEDNVLRAGDRNGAFNIDVMNEEIQNQYYWRYIK